ncbi:hypothetical protein VTK26DRAFT_8023 [Humicola hyalothermophila]
MSEELDDLPLAPSRRKRLYEPVILLDALRSIYNVENSVTEPDLESTAGKSPRQIFFCFVNKLSQICDNEPRQMFGKSVTAFVILDSGTIEYRFACNQREEHELETVKNYVTGILDLLNAVTDDQLSDKTFMATVSSRILRRILAFNRRRIEMYLDALSVRLEFCIASAAEDGTREGETVSQVLRGLEGHIDAALNAPRDSHDEFTHHAQALLNTINTHYRPSLENYLKQKTRGNNITRDSPWSEARHALGRLLSYFIAVKVLIEARQLWPQLFVDFEINWIPSSVPSRDPPDIRRNAKGIIHRMGRKATMNAYQQHERDLQSHKKLDDLIKKKVHPSQFRPIVHAEVHLLDSVLRDQAKADAEGEDPLRFFNEAEFGGYIGSSKPTCLLCHYYFNAHPSGVQCRSTHGNLYPNWRPPSVFESDGAEAEEERDAIVEAMIKDIRNETVRAIQQRSSTRKRHDSRDTPTNPWRSTVSNSSVAAEADDIDLASRLGQINLDVRSANGSVDFSRETTPDSVDSSRETTPGPIDSSRETTPDSIEIPVSKRNDAEKDEDVIVFSGRARRNK